MMHIAGFRPINTKVTDPGARKYLKRIESIPEKTLEDWFGRECLIENLAWGYVETVCDLCVQMRIDDTKPIVRGIRQLKLEYDRFRAKSIESETVDRETELSEIFEETFSADFSRLFFNLDTEVKKLGLTDSQKTLVIAVQQALTVIDAAKTYALRLDEKIRRLGVWVCDYCCMQDSFLRMATVIPLFAGDCYHPDLEIRKQMAVVLANRLEKITFKKPQP